jgi:hypothetical protein
VGEDCLRNSLIYLLHIEKTAGTSIRFYFAKGFGADKCLWHDPSRGRHLRDIAASNPAHLSKFKVVGGHLPFRAIPKPIMDKSPIFVSALRDPVARIVSLYEHSRRDPKHYAHTQVANKTLIEAMKSQGFAGASDRIQIGYLCGCKDLQTLHDAFGKHKYIIGKQEKVDKLFQYLSKTFCIPIFHNVFINVTKPGYQKEIEEQRDYAEAVQLIRQMNKDEYKFYKSFDGVFYNI